MSSEPYTDAETMIFESGVPVRVYNGGHGGVPSVNVPLPGSDGDVLTVVGGAPQWQPPSGGGGSNATVVGWPTPSWLLDARPFFFPLEVPVPSVPFSTILGLARPIVDDIDWLDFGSGTGTDTGIVTLPSTSDGQTLTTPKATFSASYLRPFKRETTTEDLFFWQGLVTSNNDETPIYWIVRLTLGATKTATIRVGTSTDDDLYCTGVSEFFGTGHLYIPSAINTTASNSDGVSVRATWTGSTTWTLAIGRVSMS